ncbi:hypothetical protein ACFLQK_02970, partial [bacterium]
MHIAGAGTENNKVTGNYIGTDVSGATALGNDDGLVIYTQAKNNVIGGTTPGERNIISGNRDAGLTINNDGTEFNKVIGNYIGTDVSGTVTLGNDGGGVLIRFMAKKNVIGGSVAGEANIIANNDGKGIHLTNGGTQANTFSRNSIYSNTDTGIFLDVFTNVGALAPTITAAAVNGANYDIDGTVTCQAYPCTVELFRVDDTPSGVTADP